MNAIIRPPTCGIVVIVALVMLGPATAQTPPAVRAAPAASPRAVAAATLTELQGHLKDLDRSHAETQKAADQLLVICKGLSALVDRAIKDADKAIAARSGGPVAAEWTAEKKQMQEMQQSFNLQYLMLQNTIAHENRQYTMVTNIMKNKHDTAKNSINNIR